MTPYLDMLERERADIGAALVLTQARVKELSAKVDRYEAMEHELTRSVHLAKETADATVADARARAERIIADAQVEADRLLAEGRAAVAEEAEGLNALHMAIAAEAATLASLEDTSRISRAAAALVEIVDSPGGLGPFSQATSTLIEFAQLLQRTARPGAPLPQVDRLVGEGTTAVPSALDLRRAAAGPSADDAPHAPPEQAHAADAAGDEPGLPREPVAVD